ncbi:MAG TPA: S8 family serine peptidase [Planctomycetota bacterium]|nr:S8 family serine peptidase [Planctomycetota bacterium]HRU52203.1 S8 family serine peptidase [Planctomycetota bacterium]
MKYFLWILILVSSISYAGQYYASVEEMLQHPHRSNSFIISFTDDTPELEIHAQFQDLGAISYKKLDENKKTYVVHISTRTELRSCLDQFFNTRSVRYVEPNYVYELEMIPNDPYYGEQDNLRLIGCERAWDKITTATKKVGIIDTGVFGRDFPTTPVPPKQYNEGMQCSGHKDFVSEEGDSNCWVTPVNLGWNMPDSYILNSLPPLPFMKIQRRDEFEMEHHGTHVASIIGSVGHNKRGIAGICWDVNMICIRAVDYDKLISSWALSNAIILLNGIVDIINISLGGTGFSETVYEQLQALQAAGTIVVTSAGNEARNTDEIRHFPSGYCIANQYNGELKPGLDNIISVASCSNSGKLSATSNWGLRSVHLMAPGENILGYHVGMSNYKWIDNSIPEQPKERDGIAHATLIDEEENYILADKMSGTSMAAAHVTGGIALIWSCPHLQDYDYKQLIQLVKKSVVKYDVGTTETGGVLNIAAAVLWDEIHDKNFRKGKGGGCSPIHGTASLATLIPLLTLFAIYCYRRFRR